MATLTITTTGAQDTRIAAAFGKYLGLPGNASAAQIKAEVFNFVRLIVADQEKKAAEAAALATANAGLTDLGASTI